LLEINWIAPIVAGGVAANEARAAVHAMISTSLTTRELVNENAMSVDAATHLMIDVGSALMRRIGAEHLWVSRDEFSQAATA
jgi:hypothetical protein